MSGDGGFRLGTADATAVGRSGGRGEADGVRQRSLDKLGMTTGESDAACPAICHRYWTSSAGSSYCD